VVGNKHRSESPMAQIGHSGMVSAKIIDNTHTKMKEKVISRYCTVKTQFKDGSSLFKALMETGNWTEAQIEVHSDPQHLFGYHGDQRAEVAHIIIRRVYVGNSANDIGFVKKDDGTYEALISEFDSDKYGAQWIGHLKGSCAFYAVEKEMAAYGRTVARVREANGHQTIRVTGYR